MFGGTINTSLFEVRKNRRDCHNLSDLIDRRFPEVNDFFIEYLFNRNAEYFEVGCLNPIPGGFISSMGL